MDSGPHCPPYKSTAQFIQAGILTERHLEFDPDIGL